MLIPGNTGEWVSLTGPKNFHQARSSDAFRRGAALPAILVTIILALALPAVAASKRVGHVQTELVSEVTSIQPGQPFWVALRLKLDDHWHVYWQNPGDAGLPPKIYWQLPPGFSAGDIQWPYPEQILVPPLASFGHHGDVLLPVEIVPPGYLEVGTSVRLEAALEWLVCKEECIPGSTSVSLILPVSSQVPQINESWGNRFEETRRQLPVRILDWNVIAEVGDDEIVLSLTPPEWYADSLSGVFFFPHMKGLIDNAAEQRLSRTDGTYTLTIDRNRNQPNLPDTLTGVIVSDDGWRGAGSEKALLVEVDLKAETQGPAAAVTVSDTPTSLWQALLFAFLGGVILNLMPCVLPVLSLKVLGFVKQANEDRRKAVGHSLVFALGVLISFWVLVVALLLLRAGGEQIGWGFQLQSPVFVVILAGFMFLFGLNLLGVFEIGTSMTSVGSANRAGVAGSFLNGVTATIVATPCTAPFMGSALGFSLTQPTWVSIPVFTALALGMASPYIVLTAVPGLTRFVPKPGRWMETLKQVMGFLLLATVVWLAWVLGVQSGSTAVVALLGGLLLLGVAAWTLGRWGGYSASRTSRFMAYASTVILIAGGIFFGVMGAEFGRPSSEWTHDSGAVSWQEFSPEIVETLTREGKPVFIDFTAAWCLSCQVNERVAFGSTEVRNRLDELGVVMLKADWTSRNETITRALARFGRNSVPLYVLYHGSGAADPIILPEILTPGIVLDALSRIES